MRALERRMARLVARRRSSLVRCSRGASLTEYLLLVGCIAFVAAAGVRVFGGSVLGKSLEQAACIATWDCAEGAGTEPSGKRPRPSADRLDSGDGDPSFDGLVTGATYETFAGVLFADAPGDGIDIHPSDIDQGSLADCWLMSSLASIAAKNPEIIRNAIRANADGTYTVTFYEKAPFYKVWDGSFRKVEITVTPTFPAVKGRPVFAGFGDGSGAGRELWPMIIEKAYAQWQGGYKSLQGGMSGSALSALTGKNSKLTTGLIYWSIDFSDIADPFEKGDPVIVGTPRWGSGPLFDNDTLVTWHDYYVTGVDRTKQTVTVRNPWGWNKGETTMTFAEFKKHFAKLTVVPITPTVESNVPKPVPVPGPTPTTRP